MIRPKRTSEQEAASKRMETAELSLREKGILLRNGKISEEEYNEAVAEFNKRSQIEGCLIGDNKVFVSMVMELICKMAK